MRCWRWISTDRHGGAFAEGGDSVVWTADGPGADEKYVAVFNVGEAGPIDVRVAWAALKLPVRNPGEYSDARVGRPILAAAAFSGGWTR
jgi:hypothetical protein